MKTPFRISIFLGLIGVVLAAAQLCGMSFWTEWNPGGVRLVTLFIAGAWLAVFYEGESFGYFPPVSTRPLWVVLGTAIMAASVLWMYAIGSTIRR